MTTRPNFPHSSLSVARQRDRLGRETWAVLRGDGHPIMSCDNRRTCEAFRRIAGKEIYGHNRQQQAKA